MKVAMLLVWALFLATAVEALPGGGGRQLGNGKGPFYKCKQCQGVTKECCKKACKSEKNPKKNKSCNKACNWKISAYCKP